MENIKEMLKNKKIMTGAIAGLAVVIILIIVIAVSCGKKDDAGKGASKTEADATTVKKAEKDTADEQNTTEPDTTELSETETSTAEDSTEVTTEETTEQPTAEETTQEPTTTYTEPKTEASTQETINSQPENPVAADPQPQPEEPTTTKMAVEEPVTEKHYADNGREMSELEWNILNDYWMEDVSHQYSSVYFFEDDEYGKGIQWIDKGSTLGPYVFESDGVYKIIEVFNDTYIIDTDTTVTIIYSDGSFKEILKPSSVLSSKNNEWLNALPLGSGICKYGLEY